MLQNNFGFQFVMVVIVVVLGGKTKSTQPSFSFGFDSLEFDKILLQKVWCDTVQKNNIEFS